MNMNLGYSLAVEKLCGMKIPEKAQVIRVIIAEMNRIASHLVGMGAYGLDLGTFSPFLYAFREREKILDLFEEVCGARLTYSYITIGGVHDDLPDGLGRRCREVPRLLQAAHRGVSHAADDQSHLREAHGQASASCSQEMALSYGCTGPMLRGSLEPQPRAIPTGTCARSNPIAATRSTQFNVADSALSAKRRRRR